MTDFSRYEPSSDARIFAKIVWDHYQALVNEGFDSGLAERLTHTLIEATIGQSKY